MFGVLGEVIILREYVNKFNAQVISGGKVSMKPGCCNRGHIPKALEHPTGLPTCNQATSPSRQAPSRHPSHSSQIAEWKKTAEKRGDREGTPTTAKTAKLNFNSTNNAMLTEKQTHCKHMGRRCIY